MSNKLMEAGFGQILAYLSGHTNVLPAFNNVNNIIEGYDALKAGVSSAQTLGNLLRVSGKSIPVILQVAGLLATLSHSGHLSE